MAASFCPGAEEPLTSLFPPVRHPLNTDTGPQMGDTRNSGTGGITGLFLSGEGSQDPVSKVAFRDKNTASWTRPRSHVRFTALLEQKKELNTENKVRFISVCVLPSLPAVTFVSISTKGKMNVYF